jgi:thioredoxin
MLLLVLLGLAMAGCGQSPKSPVTAKTQPAAPTANAAAVPMENVGEADFQARVLQSPIPVLVDFWASWCGPCQTQSPIVERIGGRYTGRLRTFRVNVDSAKSLTERYQISAIPTLILFRDGKIVASRTGLSTETELAQMLDKAL